MAFSGSRRRKEQRFLVIMALGNQLCYGDSGNAEMDHAEGIKVKRDRELENQQKTHDSNVSAVPVL